MNWSQINWAVVVVIPLDLLLACVFASTLVQEEAYAGLSFIGLAIRSFFAALFFGLIIAYFVCAIAKLVAPKRITWLQASFTLSPWITFFVLMVMILGKAVVAS